MKVIVVVVVLCLGFVGWLTFAAGDPDLKARRADAAAIEQCRERAADELLELADRRAIRAQCEALTTDYRAKWGHNP